MQQHKSKPTVCVGEHNCWVLFLKQPVRLLLLPWLSGLSSEETKLGEALWVSVVNQNTRGEEELERETVSAWWSWNPPSRSRNHRHNLRRVWPSEASEAVHLLFRLALDRSKFLILCLFMFCFENVSNAENTHMPCLDPCGMAIPQVRATGLAVPAMAVARPGTDPARRASAVVVAVRGLLHIPLHACACT